MIKKEQKPFDKFHALQKHSILPQTPKTGEYVKTGGHFNAATTDIIRGSYKQA